MLDANGYSPTQLEWNMKLWWPHADALIAFLMAYKETRDENFIKKFDLVFQYTFSHVSDAAFSYRKRRKPTKLFMHFG